MLRTFHPDHLPIIGEFLITGMVWLMAMSAESNEEASGFICIVKERCLSQGMDEDKIRLCRAYSVERLTTDKVS